MARLLYSNPKPSIQENPAIACCSTDRDPDSFSATERISDTTGIQSQLLALSLTDLPAEIIVIILLKLSVRSIISCKCVCRTFRDLILSPRFCKLHLEHARTSLLIRDVDYYLAECEDGRDFDLKYCWCEPPKFNNDNCPCARDFPLIRISSKLKVSTQKTRVMLNHQDDYVDVGFDNKYKFMINSCKGLVCLVEKLNDGQGAVYNPTMGEFVTLPEAFNDANVIHFRVCGLGFNQNSNEFKVIRTLQRNDGSVGAEVHTLGTNSWNSVGDVPHSALKLIFPTYFEGALYWVYDVVWKFRSIISFDLDNEKFDYHSIPPQSELETSIGVIEGGSALCLCGCSRENHVSVDGIVRNITYIDVYVMKEKGDWESWTKLYSIKTGSHFPLLGNGYYLPIYSSNGALLMYRRPHNALLYYDRGLVNVKYFYQRDDQFIFKVVCQTPSLISLRDIVTRENANSNM